MKAGEIVLFIFNIQHAIISWIVGGILLLFKKVKIPRWENLVLMTTSTNKEVTHSWNFGRLTVFSEKGRSKIYTKNHEKVHRWQSEDLSFIGFCIGFMFSIPFWFLNPWWIALIVWESLWLIMPFSLVLEYFTANLRFSNEYSQNKSFFKKFYEIGSHHSQHERSAYAQSHKSDMPYSWWNTR